MGEPTEKNLTKRERALLEAIVGWVGVVFDAKFDAIHKQIRFINLRLKAQSHMLDDLLADMEASIEGDNPTPKTANSAVATYGLLDNPLSHDMPR